MPSVAASLAVGALVVLAAGSAVAVPSVHAKISGSTIKNHSIAGAKLKNNTVTGKQVKESTLGTVPNAAKLGGVPASSYVGGSRVFHTVVAMTVGQPTRTLGTFGPLTFTATCTAGSGGLTTGDVLVTTSQALVFQGGMASVGVLNPSTVPFEFATEGETSAAYSYTQPFAYTSSGSFVLDGVDPIDIVVNEPANTCVFIANLVNHAS